MCPGKKSEIRAWGWVAKTITCLLGNLVWYPVRSKWIIGPPISLLEHTVFIHVLAVICSYILWWSEPLNVAQLRIQNCAKLLSNRIPNWPDDDIYTGYYHLDELTLTDKPRSRYQLGFGVLFAGAIYGSAHLAAWYWHFATGTESILYRTAAIYTVTGTIFHYLASWYKPKENDWIEFLKSVIAIDFVGARVYLVV
ncbi:hypothetical protein K469DRAFT_694068 [Zopfia rhizophila CBS 207.26]|uniref:Uncharacterized protein n=1 Tax=Zopfia rhizophila CBS 207.26 TaxID=1314779 RepID=A0A6A6DIQ1_9PEZI|nr:hypothetical protein K469DRAFT_694068 [Zopfia rhizophila CBS 207.26]